ncbi:PREDICTED: UDP-glucuronosyltransferase 2B31-like [Papilio xuthus]|uniref:UDP-glucuronosyltransferase 2B31-like n=1 Tax=Papilio xuthus TaxID=66420 RepID=A0AAJ6ZYJ0_PAPXU|nr:PREDICTED: UDP-glucuronosyltransferase 2B31-like [Papilio xuthus]
MKLLVFLVSLVSLSATAAAVAAAEQGHMPGAQSRGRVLLVFPVPGKSHSILGNSIADILIDDGYEVTYVTPFPAQSNRTGLTVADISSILVDDRDSNHLDIASLIENPKPSHWVLTVGHIFAKQALHHAALQELLNDDKVTFDLVIADWFYSGLLAPLAAVFDCPLVWYSSGDVSWQSLRYVHETSSPALAVDPQARHAPVAPLNTGDKLRQMLLQLYLTGWTHYYTSHVDAVVYREVYSAPLLLRGRRPPPYESLVYNGSLLLVNCHPPVGHNLPLPGNVQYVGGHHLSTAPKALPIDLQRLLDESTHGVIYFNLGSNVRSRDLPAAMTRDLLAVLSRLRQTVLWKFEERLENVPGNVHLLDWAPQEAILAHPNMLVFISHAGLLSVMEATQHGVPLLGLPIFGDQFVNIDLVVQRGYGLRVDFSDNLPARLQEALREILNNPSYRENAKQASQVFRERLAGPHQALSHWVRLVTRTRGAPHLQPPARHMSTFVWLHLDILLVFATIGWFLSKVAKVIKVHLKDSQPTDDSTKKNE